MAYSVHDMKAFYQSRGGRLVRRLLLGHVRQYWPEIKRQELLGAGYAAPLLKYFDGEAAHTQALMLARLGVHRWPEDGPGRVALCDEAQWPIATESVDRVLMIHMLEHADRPEEVLSEAWRVLKSSGRLMLIVPRRLGLWARADWTPFGHGRPFTSGQMRQILQDTQFVREGASRALFMPPFRSFMLLRSAYTFEAFGRYVFPGLSGIYVIEASKQIYGGIPAVPARKIPVSPVFAPGVVPG